MRDKRHWFYRLLSLAVLASLLLAAGTVWADDTVCVVQSGDTLFRIALRYNTTVTAIMQANGLTNPNVIYVGQRLSIATTATPAPTPVVSTGQTTYTVQTGDTLFRIALRYNVTVAAVALANGIVNPSQIYPGQVLVIDGVSAQPTPQPTPSPEQPPAQGVYYTVKAGDTLFRIAVQHGTSAAAIVAANNLVNPNVILVGQRLWIPGATGTTPSAPATPQPAATPVASTGFGYGIQVHLPGQDKGRVLGSVNDLGFGWIKQQVEWKVYEPTRGQISWSELDAMVDAAQAHNVKLLFSVVKAPAWARTTSTEDGPPANYQDYWTFVSALANRYKNRVAAYEVWNEQNLRREWNGDTLSAERYIQLLAGAYNAIKAADPQAMVVSGGLAPTGWNDGVTAIDDRVYLEAMYAKGLKNYSDAIGAHPNGWANGPTAICCRQEASVPSHNDHPSFFFRHTLEDYWNIMARYGDTGTRIWATEFGWGTLDGLGGSAQSGYEFVSYNTEAEQATYLTQAFTQARSYNFVGVMFVWNLNFCPVAGGGAEQCYWGIVRPDWAQRPAYGALKAMAKP
jgi:LysM repeat protein